MRKLIAAILSGVMLLSLCSCGSNKLQKEVIYPKAIEFYDYDGNQKLQEENPIEGNFKTAVNTFSYNTAEVLLKDRTDNFNYSPLSLYYALALAGTGAEGETQQQIFKLLGAASTKELSTQCGNLYRFLYADNNIRKLKIANSLWLDKDSKFRDSFVSNAAENFYASAYSVDFSDKNSAKDIAQWISENTYSTLEPNLEIIPEQILSIINTIYFYDEWVSRFDKNLTKEDTFHAESKDVKTDFMNQTFDSSAYVRGEHFTRSSLCLKGNGEMTFILPDKGVSVSDLISRKGSIQALFEEGEYHGSKVIWKIPKFKFDNSCKLKDTLRTLGVVNAFEQDADFSGITDDDAFIYDITQQTHIAIDENGVEASAFTQILYTGASFPDGRVEMILDRPFIYGITSPNGTLIFIGICNNPSE
jgi:serpin B